MPHAYLTRPSRFSAERLRRIRETRGMTSAALAHYAPCSDVTLWRIESGMRTPSVDLLAALAAALNVPIDDLFDPLDETT